MKVQRIKRLLESLSKEEIEKLSYLLQDDSYLNRGSYMARDLVKKKDKNFFIGDDRTFEVKVYNEDNEIISFEEVDLTRAIKIGVREEDIATLSKGEEWYYSDPEDPLGNRRIEIKRID